MAPAAGSISHIATTVAAPTNTDVPNAGMTRMTRSCIESTSRTMPGEQVAAVERRQASRCQPLELPVDVHAQVGQQPERAVVADQPLAVAQ